MMTLFTDEIGRESEMRMRFPSITGQSYVFIIKISEGLARNKIPEGPLLTQYHGVILLQPIRIRTVLVRRLHNEKSYYRYSNSNSR